MELRLKFDGEEAGRKLKRNMDKAGQAVRDGMREASHTAADEILFRGAEDISSAGNFGERWQEALNVDIQETQRTIYLDVKMTGGPPVSYWKVFEYGADIHAKGEYMWLPFPGATDAVGLWPRAYPGALFRVTSKAGNPVLFDVATKEPKYFGKESVHIDQKFHLRDIIAQVARELRSYYAEHMS